MILHKRMAAFAAMGFVMAAGAHAQEAEVMHWWTSEGESKAVAVFADAYGDAGGVWVDSAIAGGPAARQAAITRIVAGDPPTANQFNTSREFEDLVEQGLLADLGEYADTEQWKSVMPESLVETASRDGKFYALPINIHGRSWIFYNADVLEEVGAEPPQGWGDDMFAALDKVKAAGKVPLALSGTPVYELMVFHSIMLDRGGADLWYGAYRDRNEEVLEGDAMRETFETFARLRDYVDPGSPGRLWNAATNMVITGDAAFTSVGDWAKAEFLAAGMTPGEEFGCILPGGVLSIGGDVFVFPVQKDEDAKAAQALLVEVMSDPQVLKDFNLVKGSIPPRSDIDMSDTDVCTQIGSKALQSADTRLPRMSMLVPGTVEGEVQDLVSEFWNDPSMTVDEAMERHAEIVINN